MDGGGDVVVRAARVGVEEVVGIHLVAAHRGMAGRVETIQGKESFVEVG